MNFMNNSYQKVNTFSRKIQLSQMFTYCLIAAQLTIFQAAIQTNYVSIPSKIVMNFFMVLSFVILVITCYKSSSIDPVDSIVLQYRNGDQHKITNQLNSYLYCDSCNSYVKKSSKHCKLCDRCVENFDHHCNWINNCIGLQNYYWFFVMIIAAFFYMLFYCVSVGLLYQEQNWSNFLPAMIVAWMMFGITLPFSVLLFILVCFHINLLRLGVSTYDYIMLGRSGQQKKIEKHEEQMPQNCNKTQQSILPDVKKKGQVLSAEKDLNNVKPTIFQRSEDSSQTQIQKVEGKKQSTRNPNPSTQGLKYNDEQHSNEKDINNYFKKHKSMKFLVGQSFIVQNHTQMGYFSRNKNREKQKDNQKHFRSLNYQQSGKSKKNQK